MASATPSACQKLGFLIHAFACSVSIHFLAPLFGLVFSCFSRLLQKDGKECHEREGHGGSDVKNHYYSAEEPSEVYLTFKFPTLEELMHSSIIQEDKLSLFTSEEVTSSEYDDELTQDTATSLNPIDEDFFDINLGRTCYNQNGNSNDVVEENNYKVFDDNVLHFMEFTEKPQDVLDESLQLQCEKNLCLEECDEYFLSDKDFKEEFDIVQSHGEALLHDDHNVLQNLDALNSSDFLSPKDFDEKNDEKPVPENSSEDSNELEPLWEHQELIDQLKMELRKVRAIGLPTILEESESPKIMEDLKPWKIDEKFQHEDCIGELHKFYKSYRERMRKFDILNYQKMYAIGFMQLKDPLQSISKKKPSPPTLRSLVSQNLWISKHKIHGSDPMRKFINELQGDLEAVYIGQICLSWEFLHWQYGKALALWNSDPHGTRRYNQVAGEFQQFQVLIQRFIEDEPFQGPRVQNYVKSRCVLRNLLQVPVIREDSMKDRRKTRKKETVDDEYVVTSGMLVEILEECIRLFWLFIRADKDCAASAMKKKPESSNFEEHKLRFEVGKTLAKKERKVKEIVRSEKCILRRFRQCRGDGEKEEEEDYYNSDQVLHFFCQVDMRLVSRVLSMSKLTKDQLAWCDYKLSRISFVNRKRRMVQVDPAFLLFPC